MSLELEAEDRIILSLLEGKEVHDLSEEEQVLQRLYAEVLGLLPDELGTLAPPAGGREALLAAVRLDREQALLPAEPVRGFPAPAPSPATSATPAGPPRVRRRRWPLALAAAVAGLAVAGSAFLYSELRAARFETSQLAARLAASGQLQEEVAARLARLEAETAGQRERLALVTQRGAEACRLEPVEPAADLALARGVLYIAGDHRHWYLKVTGLPQVGPREVYQLWFVTAEKAHSGGTFRVAESSNAELGSPSMPDGIVGIMITIEPGDGGDRPRGRQVLSVKEKMRLL